MRGSGHSGLCVSFRADLFAKKCAAQRSLISSGGVAQCGCIVRRVDTHNDCVATNAVTNAIQRTREAAGGRAAGVSAGLGGLAGPRERGLRRLAQVSRGPLAQNLGPQLRLPLPEPRPTRGLGQDRQTPQEPCEPGGGPGVIEGFGERENEVPAKFNGIPSRRRIVIDTRLLSNTSVHGGSTRVWRLQPERVRRVRSQFCQRLCDRNCVRSQSDM